MEYVLCPYKEQPRGFQSTGTNSCLFLPCFRDKLKQRLNKGLWERCCPASTAAAWLLRVQKGLHACCMHETVKPNPLLLSAAVYLCMHVGSHLHLCVWGWAHGPFNYLNGPRWRWTGTSHTNLRCDESPKTASAKVPSLFHPKCGPSWLYMHMNQPNMSVKDNCARQVVRQKRGLPFTHTHARLYFFILFHGDFWRHTHTFSTQFPTLTLTIQTKWLTLTLTPTLLNPQMSFKFGGTRPTLGWNTLTSQPESTQVFGVFFSVSQTGY